MNKGRGIVVDESGKKERRKQVAQKSPKEHWKDEPDAHDFPAAAAYLSLIVDEATTESIVEGLKEATVNRGKAKDLLRASRLALLGENNAHVALDLAKVREGEYLSPVLVVRGVLKEDVALTVVDGYHRICASYHLDENAVIPYRIVDYPEP